MKVKYFTESAYLDLFDSISNNKDFYCNDKCDWIGKKFKDSKYFKESRIDVSLPVLNKEKDSDFANIVMVHSAFKDRITPKQASNPYLWTYLSHCEYWDYTFNRWSKDDMSVDTIRQRFFCGSEEGNRIGFLRNSISRLWWYGYLTYQENSPQPYKLTQLMMSHSDLCFHIMERKFSMNKEITIGILSAIQKINDDPNQKDVGRVDNGDEYEWRPLCKYINRYGGVALLDTLARDDIKELSYNFLMEYRKKWGL